MTNTLHALMKTRDRPLVFLRVLSSITLFLLGSCISTKKYAYFNDLAESSLASAPRLIPQINKNDILNITVTSLNPEASTLFNPVLPQQTSGVSATAAGPQLLGGYLVGESGTIQFPVLGTVKAAGLTVKELTDTLTRQLTDRKLLVSPIVTIRLLNFKVTVLGEVRNPTVINVTNQRISILEAIGLAGDLTIYGKRDNILIIHEGTPNNEFAHVDLTSKKLLTSPDYYLRSNDVVYVEQNINKLRSNSNARQILPILFSALSLVVVTLSFIIYKR